MNLTLKQRFARLDMSKLPKSYTDEFEIMDKETSGFSDEELNAVFEENFNDLYSLAEKKYPDAIRSGGTVSKEKPAKVKVVKAKGKTPEYKGYKQMISEATGVTDSKKLDEIEDYMRNIIFHSTLDWQSRAEFNKAAKDAVKELKIVGEMEKIEVPASLRKKLSEEDIVFIEDQLTNDEASDDEEMIAHFVKETGMSEAQARKWVALRDKYLQRMSPEESLNYPTRTSLKKEARKGKDIIKTRDDKEIDRKSNKNIGKTFYDENGKAWKCKGYNAKLDECILEDSDGKEISSCIKEMYTTNPVTKREKGNLVDDCRETLKEAGYTVKEHKAGTKKIKRSEPRPEKVIIKERVEETFTPIMKDLKGSDEKETENKEILVVLDNIQGLFTKFMNRISNLADDGKIEKLKKIEKLLKEIVD